MLLISKSIIECMAQELSRDYHEATHELEPVEVDKYVSTLQTLAVATQAQNLMYYISSSALVLFAYDHILSISREVEFIWRRNFRLTTFLYLATRYLPLPLLIMQLIPFHRQTADRHYNGLDCTDICNI
ncbi:hypothetical protein K439DRAFT_140110 [Ramaria rubella]|nr:hypothetical protein K439DRAFT_140110 [Ramaria rubella]